MPTYTFYNKETEEEKTEFMTISGMEDFLKENPLWDVRPSAPGIGYNYPVKSSKPDSRWKEVLTSIKNRNPGSTIEIP